MVATKQRFMAKVRKTPDGCWVWTGGRYKGGMRYGKFWYKGKAVYAHRFAYQKMRGRIPAGKEVLHTCDNPICVNPGHLFLGTKQTNMQDCLLKGRRPTATITREQADEIRTLYAMGDLTQRDIGRRYDITHQQVSKIVNGDAWSF